ncbi:TIR domain-containing protein [Kineosporia babensis]
MASSPEALRSNAPGGYVVCYDHDDALDRDRANWLTMALRQAGHEVKGWTQAGTNAVVELSDAVNGGASVALVVGGRDPMDYLAGSAITALLTGGPRQGSGRIVPVIFQGGVLGALLRPYISIDLSRLDGHEALRLVATATLGSEGQAEVKFPAVDLNTDSPAPRLRLLSRQALDDAGAVSDRQFALLPTGGARLYVHRDLERDLLSLLHGMPDAPIIVAGIGGVGKTSLLWGLATTLLAEPDHEVYFVKAGWLAGESPLVRVDDLQGAISADLRAGHRATLLVDTADIVVNDDRGYLALKQVLLGTGASTVVTARPMEAKRLADDLNRARNLGEGVPTLCLERILSDYVTPDTLQHADPTDDSEVGKGEFERAVAAHALEYCRTPGDSSTLASQLVQAVVRRHPLGALAQHPLTLRMLFELYSPQSVPETVDATDLFDQYWDDRVLTDRRAWRSGAVPEEAGADCSATCDELALQMLRAGTPDVAIADVLSDVPGRLSTDVQMLTARGVGSVDAHGQFSFFHQTFFEYVAARALLSRAGSPALDLVLERARTRPQDFFIKSVLEQMWTWAWRKPMHRVAATTAARNVLGDWLIAGKADSPKPGQALGSHLRLCLTTAAQTPGSWPTLRPALDQVIRDERVHTSVIRDMLALLPRPGRPMAPADLAVLAICCARDDTAWFAVVDTLSRMVDEQAHQVVGILPKLGLPGKTQGVTGGTLASWTQLPAVLSRFVSADPDVVLTQLREIGSRAKAVGQQSYLAFILECLATAPLALAPRISNWADELVGDFAPEGRLVLAHAALHNRRVECRLADGSDPQQLINEMSGSVHLISHALHNPRETHLDGRKTTERAAPWNQAVFGGTLLALGSSKHPSAIKALVRFLADQHTASLLSELNRGWLVPALTSERNDMRQLAVQLLTEGLPASHRSPETLQQRWADTIRRTLERPELPSWVVAEIVAAVAPAVQRPGEKASAPWLDLDRLLRLLMRCYGADLNGAKDALTHDLFVEGALSDSATESLVLQARNTPRSRATAILFQLLGANGDLLRLERLVQGMPDMRAPMGFRSRELTPVVMKALASDREKVRRAAGRLLALPHANALVELPPWADLLVLHQNAHDPVMRASLVLAAERGVENDFYMAERAVEWLRSLLPKLGTGDLPNLPEPQQARGSLVQILATHPCGTDGLDEMLGWAFCSPVRSDVVASLIGFLTRGIRGQKPGSVDAQVQLIIQVGRRLKEPSISNKTRSDVPGRWRVAMSRFVTTLRPEQQLTLLEAFPDLERAFATALVDGLRPELSAAVRQRMEAIVAEQELDQSITRRMGFGLEALSLSE